MQVIYSEAEKRYTLEALSRKGSTRPPSWKLIHSEPCDEMEEQFDHKRLLDRLCIRLSLENSKEEFAVSVVSNPEEQSALDRGTLKVRYRYVLSAAHQGETLIKPNSREFCIVLVNQNKLYRLEDINMMSFRGVNPIARKNYSIFKLRGHWNCRHTWQREVYLIERDNSTVENNQLINKTLEMSEEKKGLVEQLKALISTSKTPLTMSEVVELSQALIKSTDHKFKDITIGDKTLRVDGEELKEGVVVAWADADGNMMSIENEEIEIKDDKVMIVVKNSVIEEVRPLEEEDKDKAAAEKAAAEKAAAEAAGGEKFKDFEARYKKLEEKVATDNAKLATDLDSKFKAFEKSMATTLAAEIKKIPALKGEGTKSDFSSEGGSGNKYSHLSVTGN